MRYKVKDTFSMKYHLHGDGTIMILGRLPVRSMGSFIPIMMIQ